MAESNVIDAGFQVTDPQPQEKKEDISFTVGVVYQLYRVINARLLAMLALLGALAVFGFAMYDPNSMRLTGASLYSIGVLWPVMWLFSKKG